MLKKLLGVFTAACLAVCPGISSAGETDLLVQKLVEKGILTPYEAQILKDDIRQDVNKQIAKQENEMLPSWIQSIKMKGDLRVRYQTEQKEGSIRRNRGRVRYRLGVEGAPASKFLVGAGLSSGGTDPRSTNQTFDNNAETGDIRLDYAWAEHKSTSWMSLIGGKYNAQGKGYLWHATDMLWDTDINQEGASAKFNVPTGLGDVFLNSGYWVLEEDSTSAKDAGMYYGQAGLAFEPAEGFKGRVAGTIYKTHFGGSATTLQYRNSTNSTTSDPYKSTSVAGNSMIGSGSTAEYKYKFSPVYATSAELIYSLPEETGSPIKMAGIFGDYILNPDPDNQNTGWASGFKFGHGRVQSKGDWQFKYQYVRLGKDAWLDAFPDADRVSGWTNVKGHEFILNVGLAKNVSLDFDYYRSDILRGTKKDENIFQVDLNLKF